MAKPKHAQPGKWEHAADMAYIASVGTYDGPSVAQSEHIERVRPFHGPLLDKVSRDPMIETRQLHEYDGGDSLAEKQQASRSLCLTMAVAAAKDALERWDGGDAGSITHIILCTSTEYMAPTLETRVMSALKLNPSAKRTPIVMAGCAAGGIALQVAYSTARADPAACILVVAAECVSPNIYRPNVRSIDTAIAATIFSDGAGAAIVASSPGGNSGSGSRFRISDPASYTIPDTLEEMEIEPRDGGIHVALSRNIHKYASEHVAALVREMAPDRRVDGYILHPGGKSILNAIASRIDAPIVSSWETLAKYGNTSSSAIFYVLKHAWDRISPGRYPVVTFGQGIHMAAVMLEVSQA